MENSESEIEKSFQGQLDRMYEVMADSKRAAEQLRSESLSHKLEALPKFDPIEQGPLIPELEELCKINEQINKTNMEIGERLVAAGKTIDRLQMEIQEIKTAISTAR